MPKIIHEYEKCIGCGNCAAVCPKYWEITEDVKVKLLGAEVNPKNGNHELEVEKIECNQEAADSCPVQCIRIEKC